MITGVVAQEYGVKPRGTLSPRLVIDFEHTYSSVSSTDIDKLLFPSRINDADVIFTGVDLPQVLTPPLVGEFIDDIIPRPTVARDQRLLPLLYVSGDSIHLPDIRVPGFLLPSLFDDNDTIFATPLILDRGMLRATLTVYDLDVVFSSAIEAPQTFWAELVVDQDQLYSAAANIAVRPSFILNDDLIPPFSSTGTGYVPSLFIDDARPTTPYASLDGASANVTLVDNNMTAIHNPPVNYSGARSTFAKSKGRFYFEVIVGELHGARDCLGLVVPGTTYTQVAQITNIVALYANYFVTGPDGNSTKSPVIIDNHYYTTFGTLVPGDVISIAVDLNLRLIWFRKNGGHWNNDLYGNDPLPGQNPSIGFGNIPIPAGPLLPVLGFGAFSGNSLSGELGDSMTVNFGEAGFAYDLPDTYEKWQIPSPFPPTLTGDRFGQNIIAIPATLDSPPDNTIMSDGNLTATKVAANSRGMAYCMAAQNAGKFYFEVKIGGSHAAEDAIGISYNPAAGAAQFTGAGNAIVVYPNLTAGAIWQDSASTGKSLGRLLVTGDVIGIALDLDDQALLYGGLIWFRVNGGYWNNDPAGDPEQRIGGVALAGFSYVNKWVPAVGFGAGSTASNDSFTANFGGTALPFQSAPPKNFSVWPNKTLNIVTVLRPEVVASDDVFPIATVDQSFKLLFHIDRVNDDVTVERIHAPRVVGGTLFLRPGLVPIDDNIFSAGYYGSLGGVPSSVVTVSNNERTATLTSGIASVGARSVNWRTSGRYYFEVTAGPTRNSNCVGIMNATGDYPNMSPNTTNCSIVLSGGGTIYSNNGFGGGIGTAILQGDVVGVAIDLTNRRIWFRRNLLNWNNSSTANPASGVGGITIGPGIFAPVVGFQSGSPGDSWTANFGSVALVNPIPAGYLGGWPGGTEVVPLSMPFLNDAIDVEAIYAPTETGGIAVLASFDGVGTNVGLSNNNLTATHVNTINNSGARSTSLRTTGKFYFEVTMTNTHGASDCAGILTSAGSYTELVTNGTNCLTVYKSNGNIFGNNANSLKTLGAIAAGDVIGIAVDLTTRKGWIRKNGGNWNGLAIGSENPATGLGGVTLPATVSFSPAVGFGGSGTAASDAMTGNFGTSAFQTVAPAGFGNWTF